MKIFIFLLITLLVIISHTSKVEACSCVPPASPRESLEQSDSVFAGKVTKIEKPTGKIINSDDPVKVSFDVSRTWKGLDGKTITLTTALSSASCGYDFKINEEYIIYAYNQGNNLNVDICSRTNLLSNAEEDIKDLGEGNLATNNTANSVLQNSNVVIMISIISIIAGIFLVVGIGFVFIILRQKKG